MDKTQLDAALATLTDATDGTADWSAVASSAQWLADALGRDDALRPVLGERDLPRYAASVLQRSDITAPARVQLCRVIGNLCVGEQDVNRQHCLDADAPAGLAAALSQREDVMQLKAATGAALNLSMDYEAAYTAYASAGLLQALLSLLRPDALQPLLADEQHSDLAKQILRWAMQIVEEILTAKTILPAPLLRETVATLCSIILSFSPTRSGASGIESDTLVVSAELLEAITLDEDAATGAFISPGVQPLALLLELCAFVENAAIPAHWQGQKDQTTAFNNVVAACSKVIAAAAADAAVRDAAFAPNPPPHDLLETFVSWIKREGGDAAVPIEGERADLLVTATISLGNLARSDARCVTLAHEHHLVGLLARIYKQRTQAGRDRTKGRPGENTQVLHGVTGLLKHLSIPAANKSLIGDAGVIEAVSSLLRSTYDVVSPLQQNAVGLLKHLCAHHLPNALRVADPAIVTPVLDLLDRTDDVRLRNEATRILANAARSLWSANLPDTAVNNTPTEAARAHLAGNPRVAAALAEMVRTGEKYPILINEGLSALAVLATLPAGAANVLLALSTPSRTASVSSAAGINANVNGYTPSPATTAPMPFSNRAPPPQSASTDPLEVVRRGSLPPSRRSTTSTDGGGSGKTRPSTAAQAVALHLGNPALPAEIRANACTMVDVAATQASGATRQLDELRRAVDGPLEGLKGSAVEPPALRLAAERAWRRLHGPTQAT